LVIGAEADVPPLDPHRIVGTVGLRITRAAIDDAVRTQCYQQAAELIAADAPWIVIYHDPLPRMARKLVRGMQPAPPVYFDYLAVG
jgi:ABC-type transport system substrate-binding protein